MTARLARKDTHIGDLHVPAGTKIMLALAAANRDPRRWTDPEVFLFDRPRIKEHLAFGRGAHVCAGAPLARAEVRIIIEKFLEHTSHIDLDEEKHGPKGDRHLDYEASFIIRGLEKMHLKLTPSENFMAPASVLAPERPRATASSYTTVATKIGALLSDPAAKAVLDTHFPGVSDDPRIGMAKGMTLRTVQKFAPELFTAEALDAVDADLAKLSI